jgi:hypothetical protein
MLKTQSLSSLNVTMEQSTSAYVGESAEICSPAKPSFWTGEVAVLIYWAAAAFVLHLALGQRYGWHPDELAMLDDSRHLAWGYPAYPPLTAFLGRVAMVLFGHSLTSFRLFAALAESGAVLMTGLIARELGARRGAQMLAAFAATPWCLLGGTAMRYSSFDYFFWVLSAYLLIRLLKSEDTRWWIPIGAVIGLGLMTKYTMCFFATALITSMLVTRARRFLVTRHFWYGVAVAFLIFLPNLLWQMRHHFISLAFLHFIHQRDVASGRTMKFVHDQWQLTLLGMPLWLAGLYFYLFSRAGARFRNLGIMYFVLLAVFMMAKSRGYYLVPSYPMLYAAGSVLGEQIIAAFGRRTWSVVARVGVRIIAWAALTVDVVFAGALFLPLAPINTHWGKVVMMINEDFREELGWQELTETVAKIRDAMPEQDRARLGILAMNYGEAGAMSLYGRQFGLPRVISGVDSFWQRGYGNPAPETLIVLGASGSFVNSRFAGCQVSGHPRNRYRMPNSENQLHKDIFVCHGLLNQSWPEFWNTFQSFE